MDPLLTNVDQFISKLTASQPQLRGYIAAALGDYASSQDVLQKTNLTIWSKMTDFRQDAEFLPWAMGIARNQVLSYFRDKKRERVTFYPELSEQLSQLAMKSVEHLSERQAAMRECLKNLPPQSRRIIDARYSNDASIADMSRTFGRSMPAMKALLFRIRSKLANCIERRLKNAATHGSST